MSNINGRIEIVVTEGRVNLETSMDPIIVCQVLLRALSRVFEQKILHIEPSKIIAPY